MIGSEFKDGVEGWKFHTNMLWRWNWKRIQKQFTAHFYNLVRLGFGRNLWFEAESKELNMWMLLRIKCRSKKAISKESLTRTFWQITLRYKCSKSTKSFASRVMELNVVSSSLLCSTKPTKAFLGIWFPKLESTMRYSNTELSVPWF